MAKKTKKTKKTFVIEAIEKFVVQTTYYVKAVDAEEAERLCKSGSVSYDDKEICDGDEEWIETVSVEECEG